MEVRNVQEGRVSRDSHRIENPYFPPIFKCFPLCGIKGFFPLELHRITKWGVVFFVAQNMAFLTVVHSLYLAENRRW